MVIRLDDCLLRRGSIPPAHCFTVEIQRAKSAFPKSVEYQSILQLGVLLDKHRKEPKSLDIHVLHTAHSLRNMQAFDANYDVRCRDQVRRVGEACTTSGTLLKPTYWMRCGSTLVLSCSKDRYVLRRLLMKFTQ
jgi:hypothetical protein